MKKLFYTVIFIGLTAFAWHKYYVSVTEISIKNQQLEIIIRTFPDDIENVLKDSYHIKTALTDKQIKVLLGDYLKSHFVIWIDNKPVYYKFIGTTTENEFLVILLQADLPESVKEIAVKNTILQDLYDEQRNIVHFFYQKDKKSYILIKQDPVAHYILK